MKSIVMKNKHSLVNFWALTSIFIILFTSSCREIIDFDPNDGSGRYVITAQADNYFGTSVIVQKTVAYYSEVPVEDVYKNISVKIIDHSDGSKEYDIPLSKYKEIRNPRYGADNSESSVEHESGHYHAREFRSDFKPKKGQKYTIEVTIDGKEYSATSTMPPDGLNITSGPKNSEIKKKKSPSKNYEFTSEYAIDLGEDAFGYVTLMKDQVHISGFFAAAPNSAFSARYLGGYEDTYTIYTNQDRDVYTPDVRLCFVRVTKETYDYMIATNFLGIVGGGPPSKNPGNPVSSWKADEGEEVLGHFSLKYITAFPIPELPQISE